MVLMYSPDTWKGSFVGSFDKLTAAVREARQAGQVLPMEVATELVSNWMFACMRPELLKLVFAGRRCAGLEELEAAVRSSIAEEEIWNQAKVKSPSAAGIYHSEWEKAGCPVCGELGHQGRERPYRGKRGQWCGKTGHTARGCFGMTRGSSGRFLPKSDERSPGKEGKRAGRPATGAGRRDTCNGGASRRPRRKKLPRQESMKKTKKTTPSKRRATSGEAEIVDQQTTALSRSEDWVMAVLESTEAKTEAVGWDTEGPRDGASQRPLRQSRGKTSVVESSLGEKVDSEGRKLSHGALVKNMQTRLDEMGHRYQSPGTGATKRQTLHAQGYWRTWPSCNLEPAQGKILRRTHAERGTKCEEIGGGNDILNRRSGDVEIRGETYKRAPWEAEPDLVDVREAVRFHPHGSRCFAVEMTLSGGHRVREAELCTQWAK